MRSRFLRGSPSDKSGDRMTAYEDDQTVSFNRTERPCSANRGVLARVNGR